jgi:hypothetical protein
VLRAGRSGVRVSGGAGVFSSPARPDRLWGAEPTPYPMGTRDSIRGGGVKWPRLEADHLLSSSALTAWCSVEAQGRQLYLLHFNISAKVNIKFFLHSVFC